MFKKRKIGNLNLEVTELGMGTAPIGGWPIAISETIALETLETAWKNGIRYFDTAPLYGSGMAEIRVGNFLKDKKREDYVISSKVGRIIVDTENSSAAEKFLGSPKNKDSNFDFSYDGVMRSFEDSLKRLQINKIDILHLHDPDNHPNHFQEARTGAIKAMIKLKDEGLVTALGSGMNQNEMLVEFAKEGCFDCFLLAGRYTLLDQTSLDSLIPICEKNNITLILGGVFNSGTLIKPSKDSYFDYIKLDSNWTDNLKDSLVRIPKEHESAEFWLNKAINLEDACEKFNTFLKKAAIQFPYFNNVVSTCVLGMNSPNQIIENINDFNDKLPYSFWEYLKDNELIDRRSPISL
jgi:D-threo-aldose 1-dehydrogenase